MTKEKCHPATKGYFVIVIASVSQRSNPLKNRRLLRQKAPPKNSPLAPSKQIASLRSQ
jgi:hypothetical protein